MEVRDFFCDNGGSGTSTEIDGVAVASTDPVLGAVTMETLLVGPGTLLVLQFLAVPHTSVPAFPVQSTLQLCACAKFTVKSARADGEEASPRLSK